MQDNTNILDEGIEYDHPAVLFESEKELYKKAVRDLEDGLAILWEMQEKRKIDDGKIWEPPSRRTAKTVSEVTKQRLTPAVEVLLALGCLE
jgi:hypothetical protein